MTTKQPSPSPFLFDVTTGQIVGIKQPDGTESLFAFMTVAENAPVDGVQAELTTDMTEAKADVTLTAVAYGRSGNTITVTYIDPSANSASLSVVVRGRDILVYLATDSGGTITSTCEEVVNAINANAAAAALVTATAEDDGSGVVNAEAKAALIDGVDVTPGNVVVIDDMSVAYIKTDAQTWGAFYAGAEP